MNTETHRISVSDVVVDVVRKDIKNLHLAVYPPDGRVRVAVPLLIDDEAVRLAVISKLAWIKRQQALFQGQDRQSAREYVSRESHYYWGDDHESSWHPRSKNFEYTNSTETSENSDGFVFRIPLSEISIENLKIIPEKTYIIVQSNKKTIFISLNQGIRPETIATTIKNNTRNT